MYLKVCVKKKEKGGKEGLSLGVAEYGRILAIFPIQNLGFPSVS